MRTEEGRQAFDLRCEWCTLPRLYDLDLIILSIGQNSPDIGSLYNKD